MFIAVVADGRITEIATSEAASLDGMQAQVKLGARKLTRFATTAAIFAAYSAGRQIDLESIVIDHKPALRAVAR